MRGRPSLGIAGIAAVLALSGCGWAPLYADLDVGPASEELRAIRVEPIPERIGQRLELALRNSLNPTGEPTPARYVLRTTATVGLINLGVQSQGLASLGQIDVVAIYTLADLQSGTALLNSSVHVENSFDLNPNQYSTVVGQDAAAVRCVAELNQEIVRRLTLYMQRHVAEKGGKPS